MKALRYLLIAVIAIIVLMALAIVVATTIIDPNAYKPQIEKAVESRTNLDLSLNGDISWSFIPIGLEVNDVEAQLEGQRLVRLDRLQAEVDFWSLITMAPAVDVFTLDGLDARLVKNAQGQGNWERIMPEGEPAQETAPTEPAPAEEPTQEAATGDSEPLKFNVEEVAITNAQVHYSDEASGQSVTLEDFSLTAQDIALGQTFPLDLGFRFTTNAPELAVNAQLSAQLTANEALNQFQMQDLDSTFELSGEAVGGKTVNAGFTGNAAANLENETASLSDFVATLAGLELTANVDVAGFGDQPKLDGNLALAEFSIRDLLSTLGQPAIETRDPDVLKKASFSTDIGGEGGQVNLSNLKLVLDDTTFNGNFGLGLANTAIDLKLQGDAINVDRYLPPEAEEGDAGSADAGESGGEQPSGSTAAAAGEESDLLPLDTLRGLDLDIDLGLDQLIASNLTITEIQSKVSARNGLIKLDPFAGKLYDGDFNVTATLDARKDNPTWKISERANNIQTLDLLTDLADMKMLSGGANLTADITTQGNRMSALRNNAKGEIKFNLAEGSFNDMNLTRMACQGIALANQESLSTSDWGTTTPFNDMHGVLKIDGNTITNTDLTAALAGMQLNGDGNVDLAASNLDYELGLRIVGEIHRDEACRVTEYVEGVVIPVECRGDISGEPAKLCSFDGSRFRDNLKDMAASAAKKKATKEVNKAIDEKLGEKLDEKLDKESSDKIKDALKGLFN
ncbi:AsmA family protein [Marinobacter bohaiensis]|uniref:AsmA family protein n=1 Tax=Marinobacter bohaiensis TaxID=2201898 RepID=UPI000DAD3C5F|nr:AsmA family protein [Marinobacter bohaiensis]